MWWSAKSTRRWLWHWVICMAVLRSSDLKSTWSLVHLHSTCRLTLSLCPSISHVKSRALHYVHEMHYFLIRQHNEVIWQNCTKELTVYSSNYIEIENSTLLWCGEILNNAILCSIRCHLTWSIRCDWPLTDRPYLNLTEQCIKAILYFKLTDNQFVAFVKM